jgi:membrane protease YdiL (CAAX protease family)
VLTVIVAVIIESLFPLNAMSTEIAVIVGFYLYPFLLILRLCRKNNFAFWTCLKPVKFRPVKELALPVIMPEILNAGILFLLAAILLKIETGMDLEEVDATGAVWNPVMSFLSLVIFAPFFEEIIFRWFLYSKLALKNSLFKSMIISSLLFGVLHLENAVPSAIIGIVLCAVFVKYNSLFPCVIIHTLHNVIAFLIRLSAQGTERTSVSELPDAGVLVALSIVFIAVGILWFFAFVKRAQREVLGKIPR